MKLIDGFRTATVSSPDGSATNRPITGFASKECSWTTRAISRAKASTVSARSRSLSTSKSSVNYPAVLGRGAPFPLTPVLPSIAIQSISAPSWMFGASLTFHLVSSDEAAVHK